MCLSEGKKTHKHEIAFIALNLLSWSSLMFLLSDVCLCLCVPLINTLVCPSPLMY